tara:strand:+ start:1471 stop:2472 length:1002 start_codon:yes stop_codon:yes gene_type:complete
MELYMQKDLAKQIAHTLNLSTITSVAPLKINFRCPLCGDSSKDKYKCRGWFFEQKGAMKFKCFNCDAGNYLTKFAKEHYPSMWESFYVDNFRSRSKPKKEIEEYVPAPVKYRTQKFITINNLPKNHPARVYITNRKIPKRFYDEIYYTKHWKMVANKICPNTFANVEKDYPRIVFPLRDNNGLFGVQGRFMGEHPIKYQTILSSESCIKAWGLDRVDTSKPVFILEGIMDAYFIANAIAMLGGSASPDIIPFTDRVWILDREPRHKDTVKRMEKLINAGEKVLIWYRCPFKGKDINEMILNGASIVEINRYIWKNVYSGLIAKLKFSEWKRQR